jgi:NADPH:quinone reductase-like Zn-dependent oxidoreductase
MIRDPRAVFDQLFGVGATPEARARRRRKDKSILDWVTASVNELKGSLGAADQARLLDYLDDVREIDRPLAPGQLNLGPAHPAGAQAGAVGEVLAVRGRGVIVAIHPDPQPFNLFQMFWKELEVVGTRVYERADFEEAIRLLTIGVVPADTLITDVMPLFEASAAIERLSSGEDIMKLLVSSGT